MNSNLNTLRDYLMIIFRHKTVIITTFVTVMISVIIGLELKTPFYVAQVKMLISAEKQIERLETEKAMKDAINELPASDKLFITLYFEKELSDEELLKFI